MDNKGIQNSSRLPRARVDETRPPPVSAGNSLTGYLEAEREGERSRLVKALHDELGVTLFALQTGLSLLGRSLPSERAQLQNGLLELSRLSADAARTLQRIMADLRPSVLDHLGIAAALEWQGAHFAQRTGIGFQLSSEDPEPELDEAAKMVMFRSFQDILALVESQTEGGRVAARLDCGGSRLQLRLEAAGCGLRPGAGERGSPAVRCMRKRLAQLGGRLSLSRSHTGTQLIRMEIPLTTAMDN